jgi:membrane associated rhomboid family serine protease
MESGIGALIVINLVLSFSLANISVGAHVGGLIGGALAALVLRAADARRLPWLGYLGCVMLCAVAVAGAIAVSGATGTGIA